MNRKKVLLYKRISTLTQFEKGYSLEAQHERLVAYCKAMDYDVVMSVEDPGYSGSTLERPGIIRAIEAVQNNVVDAVIVYKLDRLSRSQKDVLYLIEDVFLPNKVDFISVSESFDTTTPAGMAMIGLLSVFAQLEKESIKERFMSGRQQRARRSLWHGGGTEPIGYDYVDGHLEVNKEEAYQVKLVYELYASGASLTEISDHMQERDYKTKHGGWTYLSTIINVLENPLYAGFVHFDGVIVPGSHKPIVSNELNDTVKGLRERAKRLQYKYKDSKHLLTGFIFCARCGARYFAKKDGNRYYYCCHSRAKSNKAMVKDPNCKNDNWGVAELEQEVVRQLTEASVKGVKRQEIPDYQEAILLKLEAIDDDIRDATALYDDDTQSIEQIAAKINALTMEKSKLLQQVRFPDLPISNQEELLRHVRYSWDNLDTSDRRKLISQLVNRIVIDGDTVYIDWA
jgi:site-specific DNA recombinase